MALQSTKPGGQGGSVLNLIGMSNESYTSDQRAGNKLLMSVSFPGCHGADQGRSGNDSLQWDGKVASVPAEMRIDGTPRLELRLSPDSAPLLWPVLTASLLTLFCRSPGVWVAFWCFQFDVPTPSLPFLSASYLGDLGLQWPSQIMKWPWSDLSPRHCAATILALDCLTLTSLKLGEIFYRIWAVVIPGPYSQLQSAVFDALAELGLAGPLRAWTLLIDSASFSTPPYSRRWNCLGGHERKSTAKTISKPSAPCPADSGSPLPSHFHQRTERLLVNNFSFSDLFTWSNTTATAQNVIMLTSC